MTRRWLLMRMRWCTTPMSALLCSAMSCHVMSCHVMSCLFCDSSRDETTVPLMLMFGVLRAAAASCSASAPRVASRSGGTWSTYCTVYSVQCTVHYKQVVFCSGEQPSAPRAQLTSGGALSSSWSVQVQFA